MRSAPWTLLLALVVPAITGAHANGETFKFGGGAQSVNLWRLSRSEEQAKHALLPDAEGSQAIFNDEGEEEEEFVENWFEQPLDHFSDDPHTFMQRYWFNAHHYKKGGPVFVLDGGETSGENRLPFLRTGILEILPKATNGLGVVLEHRYYGQSIPVANFSTDSLRCIYSCLYV